jgi:hypothetical protein
MHTKLVLLTYGTSNDYGDVQALRQASAAAAECDTVPLGANYQLSMLQHAC